MWLTEPTQPGISRSILVLRVCAALSLALIIGCKPVSDHPIGTPVTIKAPLGLPPVPIPPGNPPTADTIALGRLLFYDKRLSQDNTLACASCHNPQIVFTDGLRFSLGVGGKTGVRNAPTIVNAAYTPFQFWDGRAASLELQVDGPMTNPIEMNQAHDVSIAKLSADPAYRDLFQRAFGPGGITVGRVENALASFERTVLSGNSAFDRYQYGGDKTAMTPAQIRGLAVFIDPTKGNCATCHTIGSHDALFTDGKFHNTGEAVGDDGNFNDVGRFHETKVAADEGAFKTPTLRNVANTSPYMHDGSLKTLKEVVDFYAGGGNSNPNLDPEMKKINLTGQDRTDLVEFMRALTGERPPNVGPPQR
ncbi:c-type cytochrome [Granulicella sp. WH15]|uniref:cytochrome-c peroxidase n=1 Tax=Granulicella sp. WH15 TaxID=2602070 RepID=UPI001366E518|nr:cytochrome c peroxidase [Granulicella sp. WH15]QHN03523.1 c-type cytochrome [Granulicella sp. WH15]